MAAHEENDRLERVSFVAPDRPDSKKTNRGCCSWNEFDRMYLKMTKHIEGFTLEGGIIGNQGKISRKQGSKMYVFLHISVLSFIFEKKLLL